MGTKKSVTMDLRNQQMAANTPTHGKVSPFNNIGNLTSSKEGTKRFMIPPNMAKRQNIASNQYLRQVVQGSREASMSPIRSQRMDASYLGSKNSQAHVP